MSVSKKNEPVDDEAAVWLARLHSDQRVASDEKAFQKWLGENPRNAEAFDAVDRMWSAVGRIELEDYPYSSERRLVSRRSIVGAVGVTAVAATGFLIYQPASAMAYETQVGEQRRIALVDGTQLLLDAQTKVLVSFNNRSRLAQVQFGRANFQVASEIRRPFIVDAAGSQIVSHNCRVDVRCEGESVQVVLIQGEAQVEKRAGQIRTNPIKLMGGERLTISKGAEKLDKPDMNAMLSWQDGQETFDNENLSDAAQEMNRYSAAKLVVDSTASEMKVSGVYAVGDNRGFANAIGKFLPITISEGSGNIVLAAKK